MTETNPRRAFDPFAPHQETPMADFPTERFARVAEPDEAAQLAAEFARSDDTAQAALTDSWRAMDDDTLREQVSALRASGHFEASEPDLEPTDQEPQVEAEAPVVTAQAAVSIDAEDAEDDRDEDDGEG